MPANAKRASSPFPAADEEDEVENPSIRSNRGFKFNPYRVCGRIDSAAVRESSVEGDEGFVEGEEVMRRK
jgi:hypothetical protein